MPVSGKSTPISIYWIAANLCAFLVGIVISIALSGPALPPISDNLEHHRVISQLLHYLLHPLTYAVVVAFFAFRIFRWRFVGFWSVVASFIVGGGLIAIFLRLQ